MNPRRVFALVAVIVIILVASLSKDAGVASTYSAKPPGAKASSELLKKLGYSVIRWRQPIAEIDDSSAILVIIEPSKQIPHKELTKWAAKGHKIVIFQQVLSSKTVEYLEDTKIDISEFSLFDALLNTYEQSSNVSCDDESFCKSIKTLTTINAPKIKELGSSKVLIRQGEGVVAIERAVEEGSIISVFSSKYVLNKNIDKFDNVHLLLNLLPKTATIYLDEFHHGYLPVVPPGKKIFVYSVAVFAAILLLLLILHTFGRAIRFGPSPRAIREEAKTIQLTQALAMLLYENRTPGSLRGYTRAWKEDFGRAYGISPRYNNEEFCQRLENSGLLNFEKIKTHLDTLCMDTEIRSKATTNAIEALELIRKEQQNNG